MKKTLSLLCVACIAVGMQAQTYMVNDFESGLNGANAAWGGTAELIDNPCSSSDNSSTKVLKVVSTEYANVACDLSPSMTAWTAPEVTMILPLSATL